MVMANIPIPKTVESIYEDYRMRREGLLMALVDDHKDLWAACGPDRDNLCLYSYPDGNWAVDLPVVEVPPELPEPVLGINFARDGMDRKDWLALCAVHSDAWLMSLIFFYAARFDADGRAELFSLVNQHPTVYEVVTGRVARNKMYKRKLPRPAGPTPAQQAGRRPLLRPWRRLRNPTLSCGLGTRRQTSHCPRAGCSPRQMCRLRCRVARLSCFGLMTGSGTSFSSMPSTRTQTRQMSSMRPASLSSWTSLKSSTMGTALCSRKRAAVPGQSLV